MFHQRPQQRPPLRNNPINTNLSSSSLSDPLASFERQINSTQNHRRITGNKLITCPSCRKDIPDRNFAAHIESERLDKDFLPCPSCGWSFPINTYGQHLEECRRTDRTGRQSQSSEDSHRAPRIEELARNEPQDTHIHNQAIQNRSPPQQMPSPANRESHNIEEEDAGCLDFLSRMFGLHHDHTPNRSERTRQEAQREDRQHSQRQRQQDSRSDTGAERQQQQQAEHRRNSSLQSQRAFSDANRMNVIMPNPMMIQGNRSGLIPLGRPINRTIRTVEMGPGGTLLIRTHEYPSDPLNLLQASAAFQMNYGQFGPMGVLLNMLNGGLPAGVRVIGNGEFEPVSARSHGLRKEVLNNMSVVKYNAAMDKNVDPEAKTCPICLDQYEEGQELRFLWCMHRFHRDCIDSWLDKHTNCPICKKDFSEAQNGFSP